MTIIMQTPADLVAHRFTHDFQLPMHNKVCDVFATFAALKP